MGGTPGLIAATFLAENLFLALVAGAAGLAIGWLAAPLLTSPGAALVGAAGAPSLTPLMVVAVRGVALVVALASTLSPAIRAARSSTVSALADSARPPRRHGALIRLSSRLPVPALFGLRLAARRPRLAPAQRGQHRHHRLRHRRRTRLPRHRQPDGGRRVGLAARPTRWSAGTSRC